MKIDTPIKFNPRITMKSKKNIFGATYWSKFEKFDFIRMCIFGPKGANRGHVTI